MARAFVVLFALLALCAGCSASEPPKAEQQPVPASEGAGLTAFALDLYAQAAPDEGNFLLSPYSISSALAMTWAGARGRTADQLQQALRLPQDRDAVHARFGRLNAQLAEACGGDDCLLSVANAMWIQWGFLLRLEYAALLEEHYGAEATLLDFRAEAARARVRINRWVSEKTAGRIEDLIPAGVLGELTRLVLTNAVYFKGKWALPFQEDRTTEQEFWIAAGRSATVPTMQQQAEFLYAETDGAQALELPYGEGELTMLLLLPRERTGLQRMEESLTAEGLKGWTSALARREVRVMLPRFAFSAALRLGEPLRQLGVTDLFDPDEADLSGISGRRDLHVSAALHRAFVEVNEEGTEAAAATGVVVGVTSLRPGGPAVFRADHPFLFLIRHAPSDTVLFMGRVADPSAG